jgi:biopolymer transport protein ExbD
MSQPDPRTAASGEGLRIEDLPAREKPVPRAASQLNMTPMIDVVFLLLIFFIVNTEFRVVEGVLPTKLPPDPGVSTTEPEKDLPPVRIVLTPNPDAIGREFTARISCADLGVTPQSPAHLTQLLEEQKRRFEERWQRETPVIIRADSDVIYNDVVLVYDAVIAARMKKVSFGIDFGRSR